MNTQETQPQDTKLSVLQRLAASDNLVPELDENLVNKIGQNVVKFANDDDASRADWLKKSETAMKLALQVVEAKSSPWPGASNIKFPLITTASLQFHARAYPAIVPGNKVVKGQVTGKDDGSKALRADRIAQHMNWQLLEEDQEWEENSDKMLLALAVEGCEFKKTYFSAEKGHNVSEWIRPKDLIVHNDTKSLDTCPRITQPISYYPHEIDDRVRSGVWVDEDLGISSDQYDEETLQDFYEQHTFLDLDEDGRKEPYIVTVHKDSNKVVRIKAGFFVEDIEISLSGKRGTLAELSLALGQQGVPEQQASEVLGKAVVVKIPRISMYTKYSLIPSPDGSFYDLGFGQLVGPLSDSVDTTLNQLMDAGTLSNTQAGFVAKGVSIGGQRGDVSWERGKFKEITLPAGRSVTDSIMQMKFPEPSLVLFNLMGTLIQAAKDVTSVQDIMSGAAPQGKGEAATTSMIRIEQGLKVFNSIYKRIYRSLKAEFRKLYKLNSIFLEPEQYFRVLDTQEEQKVAISDYQGDGTDVQPVADPQLATNLIAIAKNQAMMGVMQHPLVNDEEVLKRFFDGLDIPAPERLIIPQEQRQQGPSPEQQLELQREASEHMKRMAEVINLYADTVKKLAQAEAEENGPQMQLYMKQLEMMQGMVHGQGNTKPMEAQPGNQGGVPAIGQGTGPIAPPDGGIAGGGLPETGAGLPVA